MAVDGVALAGLQRWALAALAFEAPPEATIVTVMRAGHTLVVSAPRW